MMMMLRLPLLLILLLASPFVSSSSSSLPAQQPTQDQPLDYPSLLQRLWQYQPELPESVLDASRGIAGDTRNLERCLWKMMTGQPTKVVLMGGSLSLRGWNAPDQAYIKQVHKWLELVTSEGCAEQVAARGPSTAGEAAGAETEEEEEGQPAEGKVIERGPSSSALHQVPDQQYQQTGHMCSTSHIQLVHLAVPAAGPGYAERCVLPRLPEDSDLVIMDWGVNDFVKADRLSHPERHALERILRSALALEPQPAVVMFEAYSWFQAAGTFVGYGKTGHNLAQDKHSLLADYYGNVQVVSARASLYQLLAHTNDTADRLIYLGADKSDLLHVTNYGHRWYADILINFLRDHMHALAVRGLAAQALRDSGAAASGWTAGLKRALALPDTPLPALNQAAGPDSRAGGGVAASHAGRCWAAAAGGGEDGAAAAGPDEAGACEVVGSLGVNYPVAASGPAGLKPPFFRDNEADPGGVCAIGQEFRGVVTGADGWDWVDDGRPGAPKLGYTTQQVDSPLAIRVDMWQQQAGQQQQQQRGGGGAKKGGGPSGGGGSGDVRERGRRGRESAWLIYLTSWHGMGRALVSCGQGCSCTNSTVDAFNKDTIYKTTTPALHGFTLQVHEQPGAACEVQVQLLPGAPGGPGGSELKSRFKVMGITTSNAPVWHLSEVMRRVDP